MADRENEAPSNDKDGQVQDKDPAKGLKRAVKTLQSERDALAKKIADMEAEVAKSKMSEQEKTNAELARIAKERDDARREVAEFGLKIVQERRVSQMVAKHGLKDPDFGDLVLKGFNPDEHDDFDAFVESAKKSKKFQPLFNIAEVTDDKVLDDNGQEIVPAPPSGKRPPRNTGTKVNLVEHEQFARERWPNDPEQQKVYIANIESLRGGR